MRWAASTVHCGTSPGAWLKFGPCRVGRVGLALRRQSSTWRAITVEDRAEQVPLILYEYRSMRAILGSAERIESVVVTGVHAGTNGSMQRRSTSSPRMRVTHSRIVSSSASRRRVPKKRAYAARIFPGKSSSPSEQVEHAVRAEDELELSFGSLP